MSPGSMRNVRASGGQTDRSPSIRRKGPSLEIFTKMTLHRAKVKAVAVNSYLVPFRDWKKNSRFYEERSLMRSSVREFRWRDHPERNFAFLPRVRDPGRFYPGFFYRDRTNVYTV